MTATARTIEVFRPGTFTPMNGAAVTFSADDLKAIAAHYDVNAPAPAVVGHPATDAPAYAWAQSFTYDEASGRLLASLGEVAPEFADAVAAGRYKKISLSLFSPDAPNNPAPGKWYPKHIGFLGGAAPAVPGLKPVSFAEDAAGVLTFEFADARALRDVAGLFRNLREWMIEKFGGEAADKVLPGWTIGWVDDAADSDPEPTSALFSEPKKSETKVEPSMSGTENAAAAADLTRREAEIAAREQRAAHADNVAFAERLVTENRLLPASKDRTVALLDALSAGAPASVEFSEGNAQKKETALDAVRAILQAQPAIVSLGAQDTGTPAGSPAVSFAAPDGYSVDTAQLELHNRALNYQRAHPDVDYLTAVRAAQG